MLIIFKRDHSPEQIEHVKAKVLAARCEPDVVRGAFKTTINVLGDDTKLDPEDFHKLEGVEEAASKTRDRHLRTKKSPNRVGDLISSNE